MSHQPHHGDDFDAACIAADDAITKMFASYPKSRGLYVLWRPGFLISRLKKLEKRMQGNRKKGLFHCRDCGASVCLCEAVRGEPMAQAISIAAAMRDGNA